MRYVILIFLFFLLISCASSVVFQPYSSQRYAPTNDVQVYTIQKPDREYIEIGLIEVTEGSGGGADMLQVAIKKAKEIGADAIILMREDKDTYYLFMNNMMHPRPVKKMAFVAIKFK